MITAFGRALGISTETLMSAIGHDGTALFPNSTTVRSHHVQEILDVAHSLGALLTPIELVPQSYHHGINYPVSFGPDNDPSPNFDRFKKYVSLYKGVICGARKSTSVGHAVYWDQKLCHDSSASWELFSDKGDFVPGVFWIVTWIR